MSETMYRRPSERRIFLAGLAHETNSFSPLPTSLRNFEEDVCYRPPCDLGHNKAVTFPGYGDVIAVARERGDHVVHGPFFWTQPSGPVSAPLYHELRDEILESLRNSPHIDMVILMLHGAMMAQGTDDCEGDILSHVRKIVGPHVPVGAVLDLHGNVSSEMIESGALLVGCKEYPHTDFRPRVEELHTMLSDMASRNARLVTTLRTIPMLTLQGTTEQPMRGLVDRLIDLENRDGIRSITLMHGFPWSDWSQTGATLLIISEGASPAHVDSLIEELALEFTNIVNGAPVRRVGVVEAIGEALAVGHEGGPIIISDSSDNAGGGAACDSTFLLRELIDRGCRDAALGMIWDPQAARLAADAGVGAKLRLRIGGKVGPLSGEPLDLEVQILAVRSDIMQRFFSDQPISPLGLAVALRAGGVEIVVNSSRQQVFSPECFTELGIDLSTKTIVVIKSSQHFRANFDPIARGTIYCNAPGSLNVDLSQMPYQNLSIIRGNPAFAIDRPVLRSRWPEYSHETGH
jgi:microcystin degradation protein MlrC